MAIKPLSQRRRLEHDLEHVTQEMYRQNKDLAETNRTLSLLRTIDSLVLESHESIKVLAGRITEAINGATEYPLVALLGQANPRSALLESYALTADRTLKFDSEMVSHFRPSVHHAWFKHKEKSQFLAIDKLKPDDIADFLGCSTAIAEQFKSSVSLKSAYAVKLIVRQRLAGVMLVGSFNEMDEFRHSEGDLLERLSETVGIALDNKLLFEENQLVLKQLKKANSRLRELDKTKDEFISMASHQLRTPLTTVKGYLSMMLDGDVGPVKKEQKELVQHAFDGANRMVYLIADLLNVSRLQSGKFIIDNKPTDLALLVEGEVSQLKEQAATRGVELVYHKPEHFPMLNLDETKIRQVVMNFLDNALYYTPKGGKAEAVLECNAQTVTYTVIDTGVGVPRSVQHHLFTKFYRADNARKVRPDGTGLGLYMAKKVIASQGGSIIFKSTEGKGSTFGFSFPRKKMEVQADAALPEQAAKPVAEAPAKA